MSEGVRPDWSMPTPPAKGAVPVYYLDGSEAWLHWIDPHTGDHHECDDIPWPFVDDKFRHVRELHALGFKDCEDFPVEAD
jgi:hypothetical protein